MASAKIHAPLRLRGRLATGVTDLTIPFPHGGTAIGLVRSLIFHPQVRTARNQAMEWGNVTTGAYYIGEEPYLACILRQWDDDAISAIFPNTVAGSTNQRRYITSHPGTDNQSGYDLSNKQVTLCVSPDSLETDPFLILHNAYPAVDEAAQIQYKLTEEMGIAVVFWAGVDSNGKCYTWGTARDINGEI